MSKPLFVDTPWAIWSSIAILAPFQYGHLFESFNCKQTNLFEFFKITVTLRTLPDQFVVCNVFYIKFFLKAALNVDHTQYANTLDVPLVLYYTSLYCTSDRVEHILKLGKSLHKLPVHISHSSWAYDIAQVTG